MQYTLKAYSGSINNSEPLWAIYDVVDDYDLVYKDVRIDANAPDVAAAILAVLPTPPANKVAARAAVVSIPSWASWREDEVIAWWETNIHTPLATGRAALPATIPFSAAGMTVVRTALIRILDVLDMMATMLWAMARLLVAMRNNVWPNLQNPPAGLR
jgi:hypothetical protein